MTGYLIFKTLHILFAIMFVGNIVVAIFWKLYSDKTGDPKIIANTLKGIIKADKLFTMPGVIGLLIFGFAGQGIGKIPIDAAWILWSIVLYVVSGAAFMTKVSPLQKKLLAVAETGIKGEFDSLKYKHLSIDWNIWGSVAVLAPLIAVVLMVFKPV
jgi:uncharacterized membrane protein